MTKRPKIKRMKQATKAEKQAQARENDRPWRDYELALKRVKPLFHNDEAYHNWYADLHDRLRWVDHEAYEKEIFDKLDELEKVERVAFLRRIHGERWKDQDELEILEKVHNKWSHPARSDRGKYRQVDCYDPGEAS